MKSVDLRLDRIFDVAERDEVEESLPVEIDSESENRDSDVDEDYAESRRKYYELLDKGNIAIEGALELAQETDAPRAYEVVGQLLKVNSEINTEIIDLQLRMEELKNSGMQQPSSVTNALFVGSTTELQKMLKGDKKNVSKRDSKS
jgi:hypothetical protein